MTDPHAGAPQVMPLWTPPPPDFGYRRERKTNTLAIVAFAVSTLGLAFSVLGLIMCPLGAILGHVARRKIKESGEQGGWMATAGIIIGWAGFGLILLGITVLVALIIAAESQS